MQIEQFEGVSVIIKRSDDLSGSGMSFKISSGLKQIANDFKLKEFTFLLKEQGGENVIMAIRFRKQPDNEYLVEIIKGEDVYKV